MLQPITAIQNYLPSLWNSLDDIDNADIPDFQEGDLVEFDDYYEEYIGIGIIKEFTTHEFKDIETGIFHELPCAIVVSANPDTFWLDYVPMTHMDIMSLSDYLVIYEDEYNADVQKLYQVRNSVATKMSLYGWQHRQGNVPSLLPIANPVPLGAR